MSTCTGNYRYRFCVKFAKLIDTATGVDLATGIPYREFSGQNATLQFKHAFTRSKVLPFCQSFQYQLVEPVAQAEMDDFVRVSSNLDQNVNNTLSTALLIIKAARFLII